MCDKQYDDKIRLEIELYAAFSTVNNRSGGLIRLVSYDTTLTRKGVVSCPWSFVLSMSVAYAGPTEFEVSGASSDALSSGMVRYKRVSEACRVLGLEEGCSVEEFAEAGSHEFSTIPMVAPSTQVRGIM